MNFYWRSAMRVNWTIVLEAFWHLTHWISIRRNCRPCRLLRLTLLLRLAFGWLMLGTLQVTAQIPPTVELGKATDVTALSAVLNATVNPNGSETVLYFQLGDLTNVVSGTTPTNIGTSSTALPITALISDLDPGSGYFFSLVASNIAGVTRSSLGTFTTLPMFELASEIVTDSPVVSAAWGDYDNKATPEWPF